MFLGTMLRMVPGQRRANGMTDWQHSSVTDRQRGFLGALFLMLALLAGQFVTLERKISFRSGNEQAVTRTSPEKVTRRTGAPRPLSAGGGASGSDAWLLSPGSAERRAVKARAAGAGGDQPYDLAFLVPDHPATVAPLSETLVAKAPDEAVPASTPRHDFEGRAPPRIFHRA